MSKYTTPKDMVVKKNTSKVILCSTPEHRVDSPTRDSDSEAASPVPFLCTQDGAEGETDVVWNYYTPKAGNASNSRPKSSTPLSRKSKKTLRPRLIEKQLPKRKPLKVSQRNTELFQDLIELNQNVHKLIAKKPQNACLTDKQQSGSEEDIFNDSPEYSPKSTRRNSSRCLRKNVLSSNFYKPESDTALESDDSMNECLLKASQVVEEQILNSEPEAKRSCHKTRDLKNLTTNLNKMDNDSMDLILNSIILEIPSVKNMKCNSPGLKDDSFDSIVGNLNDSALEQLTQMPVKMDMNKRSPTGDWTVKELVVHDGSPINKSRFSRHSSMPESPSMVTTNKPSTSGMVFGRYSSMPFGSNNDKCKEPGDSPIRCTQDEIKKKHQLAREKLLAKRLFPYSSSQNPSQTSDQTCAPAAGSPKKTQFRPKVASSTNLKVDKMLPLGDNPSQQRLATKSMDLKLLIEKKRQEALMKLRRRLPKY